MGFFRIRFNMIISLSVFFACLAISFANAQTTVQMQVFAANGTTLGTIDAGGYIPNAALYVIGQSTNVVEVWVPYGPCDDAAAAVSGAARDVIVANRTQSGQDRVAYKLVCLDWGAVGSGIVCQPGAPCPAVAFVGTTQVAGRVEAGDAEPLSKYFQQVILDGSSMPSDDFPVGTLYDYFHNGKWFGVPFMTDIRLLYYNYTTFTNMNANRSSPLVPPPTGNDTAWGTPWSVGWNISVFTEYVKAMKQYADAAGITAKWPHGTFGFQGGWDEEYKLVATLAREYGATVVNDDFSCGMTTPRFKQMLQDFFIKMYFNDSTADLFGTWNLTACAELAKKVPLDPLDYGTSVISIQYYDYHQTNGFFWTSNDHYDFLNGLIRSSKHPNGEWQVAYPPTRSTFLGGSGMMIMKNAPEDHKQWGWKLMNAIVDRTKNYMDLGAIAPPPSIYRVKNNASYSTGYMSTAANLLQYAVPSQYPLQSFPQFSDIELLKPVRVLLYELLYLNRTIDVATERACKIVDYIFLPACNSSHWSYSTSAVDPNSATVSIQFDWKNTTGVVCKGGQAKPHAITDLNVEHLPIANTKSLGLLVATIICSILHVVYMGFIYVHRNRTSVRRASQVFSHLIIFGGLLTHGFNYLSIGVPTSFTCIARSWFLVLGFALCFGSLTIKTYRIYAIFHVATKQNKTMNLSNLFLLRYLALFLVIEIALLILWSIWGNGGAITQTYIVPNTPYTYDLKVCTGPGTAANALLLFYNGLMVLLSAYLTFLVRNVVVDYNENKF
ncbi:hypothetical protein HK104_007856, partial [Borealophlyctis nickersoniae]